VADWPPTPPTYELASALDGSPQGLTYGGPGGSQASGRVALSADGRTVVFVTTATSDLTSNPGGSTEGEPTPAGQVVVRGLDSLKTTLVSVARDPESGAMSDLPVNGGAVISRTGLPPPGAAISGDGTTVAWLGSHLPAQVPLLEGERQAIGALDTNGVQPYDEPLWRRFADGPGAPTRRMVGGGDPLAPGCPADGTLADEACQGPFPGILSKSFFSAASGWLGRNVDGTPQLSFNGRTAALIGSPTEATNLFLVEMTAGLSRKQAVHQLTRQVPLRTNPVEEADQINLFQNIPLNGDIYDVALSADGNRIGFATARQQFPLAPPNLITTMPASLGQVELYLVSRDAETLQRVTHGAGGASEASLGGGSVDHGAGASSPSFDFDGRSIGFASTASNLVQGDGNEASDAFVIDDGSASREVGPLSLPPGSRAIRTRRHWRFTLSSYSLPDGAVRIVALVPGKGKLQATASAALTPGRRPRLLTRAGRRAKLAAGGPVKLDLKLPPGLRHLSRTSEGLYAMASVRFKTKRGKTLRGRLQVRFHRHSERRGGRR
jgi:hypothetical protein